MINLIIKICICISLIIAKNYIIIVLIALFILKLLVIQ